MMRTLALASVTLLAVACSESPADSNTTPSVLLSVTPAHGTADVTTTPTIEVRFDRPVAAGAAMLIALQVGDCPGPVVSGTWSRSTDGTALHFHPMDDLSPGTRYSIHVGGGMTDEDGNPIDMETHGPGLGGMWVTESMVMGMNGMGMGSMVSHAGAGWRHANGFYGLAFGFTTGN
jgi:hypothetical protein